MMLETESSITELPNMTPSVSYDEAIKNFLGNYVWRAVHAFMDHQDFDASPIWISSRLNITVESAAQALDGLVLLGLAERTAKGFQPKQIQFLIPETEMEIDTRMAQHALTSQQIMNRLDPKKWTLFRQGFVASNKPRFNDFREKLDKLVNEFFLESNKEPKDGLYCFTATGVDIMEKQQGNGGAQ